MMCLDRDGPLAAEKYYRDIGENQKHYICRLDQTLRVTFAKSSQVTVPGSFRGEVLGVSWFATVSERTLDLSGGSAGVGRGC